MIGVIKSRWTGGLVSILGLMMTITTQASAKVEQLKPGSQELRHFVQLMQNNLMNWSFHKDDEVFDDAAADYTARPDAVFWDTAPPLQGFRGWAEYRMAAENWVKHGIDQADISLVEPEKFKAWRYKDVVWNTMHCRVGLTMPNGEKPVHLCRGTVVWEWEGDRWRLAHETFSGPVKPGQPVFQATRPEDPRIEPHQELMARAKQLAAAWGNGSTRGLAGRLADYYVKDDNLAVYTPWPPFEVYQGWDAFEQGLKKFVGSSFKRVHITLNEDLEAQRRGKLAWSHATLHIETELPDGTLIPGDARQTLVWFLTDKGWRILHEHFSFPQ